MKNLITIIISLAIGFAVTYFAMVDPEENLERVKLERMVYEDMDNNVLFEFKNDFLFDNETEARQFLIKIYTNGKHKGL
jgi:hypothetical protein